MFSPDSGSAAAMCTSCAWSSTPTWTVSSSERERPSMIGRSFASRSYLLSTSTVSPCIVGPRSRRVAPSSPSTRCTHPPRSSISHSRYVVVRFNPAVAASSATVNPRSEPAISRRIANPFSKLLRSATRTCLLSATIAPVHLTNTLVVPRSIFERNSVSQWFGVPSGASDSLLSEQGWRTRVIVDCHSHVMWYPDHVSQRYAQEALASKLVKLKMSGGEAYSAQLDLHSYDSHPEDHWAVSQTADKVIVFGLAAKAVGVDVPNEVVADYVAQHPEKLVGWASVDPNEPDCVEQL